MRADLLRRVTPTLVWPLLLTAVLLTGAPTVAIAQAAPASEAVPVADDPALEARVEALSHMLRCLVCQNQSIAESNAPLAVDLRNQVREQLASGKDEDAVIDFLVARYGDFVLYMPPVKAVTVVLWLGPGLLLIGCAGWLALRLRRRQREAAPTLSGEQHRRARALLEGATQPPEEPRS